VEEIEEQEEEEEEEEDGHALTGSARLLPRHST
jgi:hypothetical protein